MLWFVHVHAQSCLTLCDSMNCTLLGSSAHGIFQAGILEWVDISFSRASSQPRDWTCPSSIGRQILYHWNTWETQHVRVTQIRHGFDPWFRKIPWNRKWQRVRKAKFSVQGTETETRLCPFTVGGMGSIPGQGTKILHATQLDKKKKKSQVLICIFIQIWCEAFGNSKCLWPQISYSIKYKWNRARSLRCFYQACS